jgi:hypothetical protein
MNTVLATMVTMTTYGTWLRGDHRGWIDEGILMPTSPELNASDLACCKHSPFYFERSQCQELGQKIGESLIKRLNLCILAMTVRTWHAHFVYAATETSIAQIVKCAKDAGRYALRAGRPIWTDGYDKRWCYNDKQVSARIDYVERHNLEWKLPAKPYAYIQNWREYL